MTRTGRPPRVPQASTFLICWKSWRQEENWLQTSIVRLQVRCSEYGMTWVGHHFVHPRVKCFTALSSSRVPRELLARWVWGGMGSGEEKGVHSEWRNRDSSWRLRRMGRVWCCVPGADLGAREDGIYSDFCFHLGVINAYDQTWRVFSGSPGAGLL
jgi:hypothetical protein